MDKLYYKHLASILIFCIIFCTGCNKKNSYIGSIKILVCGQYFSDSNSEFLDVMNEFEKQTNIKIDAYSTFESNEQLYAKLKHGKFVYDLILPSDYMIGRLIQENMIQPINTNIINNYNQINSVFKGSHCGYDLTDSFSIPYTFGIIGIIYNEPLIEQLTQQKASEIVSDFQCLFNENLKKQILMFNSSKDSFAIAHSALSQSINTTDPTEIEKAANLLKTQKPLVQGYVSDEIFDKMINNEAAIAPAYSGDIINMMAENRNLKCVFPKNKPIMFVDAMCIPNNAQNIEHAHKFISFMCDSKIAAENCKFSSFSTTIETAKPLLELTPEAEQIAYPTIEELQNCETLKFLGEETETKMLKLWELIKL